MNKIIFCLLLLSVFGCKSKTDSVASKDSVNVEPSKENTREERIKRQFSAWDGEHIKLSKYVKNHMKNPDSYEHVETRYSDKDDKITVATKYRGTNSFGAIVTSFATAEVDLDGDIIKILEE